MSRPWYHTMDDVPYAVRAEFRNKAYRFNAPPVHPGRWTALDWINYVTFDNLDPETHALVREDYCEDT